MLGGMRDLELGRLVRALRRRRGWRQLDCAARASVHRSTWSLLERGHLDRLSLRCLRRCLDVLEIRLDLTPSWRGADLARLRDASHAALQALWKRQLERWGCQVWVETSFNHFGEHGRVDILAWHPAHRVLVVVEVKTEIDDVQALLGTLDVKCRVAPIVVRRLGITPPAAVLPAIVLADGSTNRDRLRRLAPLFARFNLRGRAASAWLRNPSRAAGGAPTGLLLLTDLRYATGSSVKSLGAHRVRRPVAPPSTEAVARPPVNSSRPT
jgi:transcriptional regulator with XRE-family HTH domain